MTRVFNIFNVTLGLNQWYIKKGDWNTHTTTTFPPSTFLPLSLSFASLSLFYIFYLHTPAQIVDWFDSGEKARDKSKLKSSFHQINTRITNKERSTFTKKGVIFWQILHSTCYHSNNNNDWNNQRWLPVCEGRWFKSLDMVKAFLCPQRSSLDIS